MRIFENELTYLKIEILRFRDFRDRRISYKKTEMVLKFECQY